MDIHKIVITGGPCAGKTTAMTWIQDKFEQRGWRVLFVPETATELITGGVAPWTCGSNFEFQQCQVRLQLEKERIFEQAAATMKVDKLLIVCDRGVIDNKVYMKDEEFTSILGSLGLCEVETRDSYDAVFHLVTAAKGARQFYTLGNNQARIETPEQACALDDALIAAWTGHPHLRVIDNTTDFTEKMKRLIAEITSFLGAPEPTEYERKFLIEYPDLDWLNSLPSCRKVEIIQTYLCTREGEENRVRQRGDGQSYVYYHTIKRQTGSEKRYEVKRRLTQNEYLRLLMNADPECRPIRKTRYCLAYKNQYFDLDLFPFWKDKAILEIELLARDQPVELPREIKVIQDVTGDPAYKNISLARNVL